MLKWPFWWWNRHAKQGKVSRLKGFIIAPSALWIEDSLARVMGITFDSDRIWRMQMALIIQLETSIASFRRTTSVSKLFLLILPSCVLVGLNHNYLLGLHYKLPTFPLRFKALESLLIRKKKRKKKKKRGLIANLLFRRLYTKTLKDITETSWKINWQVLHSSNALTITMYHVGMAVQWWNLILLFLHGASQIFCAHFERSE